MMDSIDLESIAKLSAATAGPVPDVNANRCATQVTNRNQPSSRERGSRDAYVMIVDEHCEEIDVVQDYLEDDGFGNFVTTTDAMVALEMARSHQPDIILLDIESPKLSGLRVLEELNRDQELRKIPMVVLTGEKDPDKKRQAIRLGAVDFLSKPVDPSELLVRIENVLNLKACQDHLAGYSERLEEQIKIRTEELLRSRHEAILCLARAAEYRDDETGQHVARIGNYAAIVADQLGFPQAAIELIRQAAQLHDIGKIGIPESILQKPGKLDVDEFSRMETHCRIGHRIIRPLTDDESELMQRHTSAGRQILSATTSPILKMAAVIAETHHEKWDGSGYPKGLSGKQIPIEGRIVAVADVFDALSCKRPYKEAFPLDKCFEIVEEGRGKHFDPRVLDAFQARRDEITRIRKQCVDVVSE